MKLRLSNIGIVNQADVELNSITVITGENNSGKSTIGKVLYSIATVQNMISDDSILINKYQSILNELSGISRWIRSEEYEKLFDEADYLFNSIMRIFRSNKVVRPRWWGYKEEYSHLEDLSLEEKFDILDEKIVELNRYVNEFEDESGENENLKISIKNLKERVSRSQDDKATKILTLDDMLSNEFSGRYTSVNVNSSLSSIELLEDNGDEVFLHIQNKTIDFEKSKFEVSRNYSEIIYFDDPFLLDEPFARYMNPHRQEHGHLGAYKHRRNILAQINKASRQRNFFEESIQDENIRKIFSKVLEGEIRRVNGGYIYDNPSFSSEISFDSLSAGMKSFSTIQMLMEYGLLNNAEYLVLDEPETHLHPEWQGRFAELIVWISVHYPIRILVTSHSPYFIEAIDIFYKKYKKDKNIKFYHSVSETNLGASNIVEVTDNLEVIFKDMYRPLNYLEELRDDIE